MEITNPLRVLIVGCGNIAGIFDRARPLTDLPYSHAGAYTRDNRFALTACVEPNEKRRNEFMEIWRVPEVFHSFGQVLNSESRFDIVSICSPTDCHAHDIDMALELRPRMIFCEKPVTPSAEETKRIVAKCAQLNVSLAVNYTRRWDPKILELQADIQSGHWGVLRSVVGYYNKGILNNGSHMLDLLYLLVGPMDVIKAGKPIYDFFTNDPTIPVLMEGPHGVPVCLVCGHAEDYAVFDIPFVFSHGAVVLEEGGMFWRESRVVDSEIFKGYRTLTEGVRKSGGYPYAMTMALENIHRNIYQNDPLASTGESALVTQLICEEIKSQACSQ